MLAYMYEGKGKGKAKGKGCVFSGVVRVIYLGKKQSAKGREKVRRAVGWRGREGKRRERGLCLEEGF